MTGKKKDMDGGKIFDSFFKKKPPSNNTKALKLANSNVYLNQIKKLANSYQQINERKISVNNLNSKVKLFTEFLKKNKINEHTFLLEEVKKILIEKIKLSLHEFISNNFMYDYTIPFSKLLDKLLDQLKEFEKLLNLLKLLDNQFNISYYNTSEESFIYTILRKYEDYIEQILRKNPNIDILEQLLQQVQNYIREYSEFIKSMNNPIYEIIQRLNSISDQISIKIQLLSGQGTNINGNQISNEIKRRIKLLYDANRNQKRINYNSILTNLHHEYQKNPHEYNLKELSILADIGSKIESISRMRNGNNKNILLRDLRKTIIQLKELLKKYPEFQKYEGLIISS